MLAFFREILQLFCVECRYANNFEEALAILRTENIDVILMAESDFDARKIHDTLYCLVVSL